MPRSDFSTVALDLVGSDHRQKITAQFLDLVATDSWVARLVESIVFLSAEQGHEAFAASPDHVLAEVHEAIRSWRVDVSYALKLARIHPQIFAKPEAWESEHAGDGSANVEEISRRGRDGHNAA